MSITYRRDYDELGLDESADWSAARRAYRGLVNTWHPDRYARRPREREQAQQRFIRLARSFDRLRAFYRENGRLPFEIVVPEAPERLRVDRVARGDSERRRRDSNAAALDGGMSRDELLGRTARPRRGNDAAPRRRRLAWLAAGLATVLATLALFVAIDREERRETYEGGRDVLLETEPSEFMPSAGEVRRRSTRGSFVTREDGEFGDQLMEDVFR